MFLFQFNKDRPLPSSPPDGTEKFLNDWEFRTRAYYYYIEDFELPGGQGRKGAFIELTPEQYEGCKEKAKKFDGAVDEKKLYENVMGLLGEGKVKIARSAKEMKDLKTGDVIKVNETIMRNKESQFEFRTSDPAYENEPGMKLRMRIEKPGKKDLDCPCIPQLENPTYYVMNAKGGKQGAGSEPGKKPVRRNVA